MAAGITAGFLVVAGMVAFIALSTLMKGWVLSIIWGWFVVSAFGLPALGVVQAMGIALTAAFLTHQYSDAQSKHEGAEAFAWAIGHAFVWPLTALGVAWCIKQFL